MSSVNTIFHVIQLVVSITLISFSIYKIQEAVDKEKELKIILKAAKKEIEDVQNRIKSLTDQLIRTNALLKNKVE
tara:strand:+ start:1303 stop:1527 length:225 start_codon:yes stop_codon:yes gene_type:complete